jgi:hemolysin activation/secretion protein
MFRSVLLAVFLLAISQNAFAQQLPGAGGQFQQIPPPPARERSIPELRIERPDAPQSPESGGDTIPVNALRITGETVFSEAELVAAADFRPGNLGLGDLRGMAARIANFYNRRGYFVAQAYVPAQDIGAGTVTIAVVEGHYGTVSLNNDTNLSNGLAKYVLSGVDSGDLVENAPLERRLLLLSDIPGVRVNSTLSPGSLVGTSDLTVHVTPGQRVTGSIEADNAGSRYTGAYRVGGIVSVNDVLGHGDVASVRVLTSFDGLNFFRGSYQMLLGNLTLGVAYGNLHYKLGKEFKSLDAHGSADVVSVYGSYPLIRSYNNNLYLVADMDTKFFRDRIGAVSSVSDRRILVGMVGLAGDEHDGFGGGGSTYYGVNGFYGNLDIRTPAVLAVDALTARSDGSYYKLAFNLARLQNVVGPLSLYASVRGQISSKNLDSSEKMELGGAYAVRAYPEGEGYGDDGYVASLEARVLLPKFWPDMPGQVQLAGFVDTGKVTLNHTPWFPGDNHRNLSAAGVGFSWADDNNFLVKASYAHRIGHEAATSAPDHASRFWIQLAKLF